MQAFKLSLLPFLLVLSKPVFSEIERGEFIYKQLCFNCHGVNLDGGIGPSLTDSYWKNGDSYEAIYRSIAKGIPGTEMIAYELVYPEKDLHSLTAFIVGKQEGNRETLRSTYPRDYFRGKDSTLNFLIPLNRLPKRNYPRTFTMWKECSTGFCAVSPSCS